MNNVIELYPDYTSMYEDMANGVPTPDQLAGMGMWKDGTRFKNMSNRHIENCIHWCKRQNKPLRYRRMVIALTHEFERRFV